MFTYCICIRYSFMEYRYALVTKSLAEVCFTPGKDLGPFAISRMDLTPCRSSFMKGSEVALVSAALALARSRIRWLYNV